MKIPFFAKGENATVQINGVTYSGNNISINADKVVVDGETKIELKEKNITINILSAVEELQANCKSIVAWSGSSIGSIRTVSGDVSCGDVSGSINTISGDVKCKKINGSVNTISGDIIGLVFNK